MRSESDRKRNPSKTENASTYLHGFNEFSSKRPRSPGGSPDLTEKRILAADQEQTIAFASQTRSLADRCEQDLRRVVRGSAAGWVLQRLFIN
jgi:inactivated superfamily I helicase